MATIGEQLRQARESRKLTIKQVTQATRLRAHYLQAMEDDDFSAMPSVAQARGFLRLYADFLGLDIDALTITLSNEFKPRVTETPPVELSPQPSIPVRPANPDPPQAVETLPEKEMQPLGPSATIFKEIGTSLRERRELISLTIEEVERHTRVRKHNLELIEAGDFDELPSPVQLRGTLSAYAAFLDLDAETLLLRYADGIQARRIERQQSGFKKNRNTKSRPAMPFWISRFISPDLIFGASMILILLALGLWAAGRIFTNDTVVQKSPTPGRSISDVLLASPIASPTVQGDGIPSSLVEDGTVLPTLDPALAPPSDTPVATVSYAVQLTIIVTERTLVRVTVDGEIKQDGRLAPGTAITFDGASRIEVLTGSGAAIQIIFNGANLGIMGNFGEVVNRIYTVNGIETPTPTVSPTPTITPKPSATPRPSATLRPSSTPRPTSTTRPSPTPAR
jgi:cytoskeleton protein RodZ